jgi:predicted phosphoribosyltransferase
MQREGLPAFADRTEAGRQLAAHIDGYLRPRDGSGRPPLVLALPRGGVPVAYEVARVIGGELDVVVSRKIGMPGHAEFGIGAVAEDGPPIFNQAVLRRTGLTERDLAGAVAAERAEIARRVSRYRGDRPLPDVTDRIVIVVDDGLATGVTAMAALRSLRQRQPAQLIFAAPVCAYDSAASLTSVAEVICVCRSRRLRAIGEWYDDFSQLTDEQVEAVLAQARHESAVRRAP